MPKPTLKDLLNLDTSETRPYEISTTPGGGFSVKADGAEDHARALEVLKVLAAAPAPAALPPAAPVVKRSGMSMAKAHRAWVQFITPSTIRKTLTIKALAVASFVKHVGQSKGVADVTRTEVAEWVQALRNEDLSTPTIINKLSYLKGFFEWAKGAGHYLENDNPATGQLSYSHREKRQRRKHGFKPFAVDQVKVLYSADALRANLSEAARWGAVLGLYTGARVAEVGQLTLDDFIDVGGVPCVRITDEGDGQSLKNDASVRTLPLHADLLALGVMERVTALRAAGETRFFPDVKVGSVNGMGNWLSKAFSRHLDACKVDAGAIGRVGFHSLRKTVIQAMQTGGVSSEHRAQFVGHDLDDEHHAAYSRDYTPAEQLEVIGPTLRWPLDLAAVRAALEGPKMARKAR